MWCLDLMIYIKADNRGHSTSHGAQQKAEYGKSVAKSIVRFHSRELEAGMLQVGVRSGRVQMQGQRSNG